MFREGFESLVGSKFARTVVHTYIYLFGNAVKFNVISRFGFGVLDTL